MKKYLSRLHCMFGLHFNLIRFTVVHHVSCVTDSSVCLSVIQQRWVGRDEASESCCAPKLHLGVSLCPHVLAAGRKTRSSLSSVLESWLDHSGELEPPDPLSRLPQLKQRIKRLLCDLCTVRRLSVCRWPPSLWTLMRQSAWNSELTVVCFPAVTGQRPPVVEKRCSATRWCFFCLFVFNTTRLFLKRLQPDLRVRVSTGRGRVRSLISCHPSHRDGMMFVSVEAERTRRLPSARCFSASQHRSVTMHTKDLDIVYFLIVLILPVLIIVCFKDSWRVLQSGETRRFLRVGDH